MNTDRVYTPEEIERELRITKTDVYPSNVKALVAIIEQQRKKIIMLEVKMQRDMHDALQGSVEYGKTILEQRAEIERLNGELFSEKLNNRNYINEQDAAEEKYEDAKIKIARMQELHNAEIERLNKKSDALEKTLSISPMGGETP